MDEGGRLGQGLKLATNSFTFTDTTGLAQVLHEWYGLKVVVQSAGVPNQYILYVSPKGERNLCQSYVN